MLKTGLQLWCSVPGLLGKLAHAAQAAAAAVMCLLQGIRHIQGHSTAEQRDWLSNHMAMHVAAAMALNMVIHRSGTCWSDHGAARMSARF